MARKSVAQQQQGGDHHTTTEPEPQPTTTEAPTPQAGGATTTKTQKGGKRTFKIKLEDDKFCSRITGNTPKQAASKALTLLINQRKQNGKSVKGKLQFTIRETTRGSKGKEYTYMGEKVKLKQPTTYTIKSASGEVKEIVNRFKNVIEKFQA